MDNTVTISNSHESELQFDVSVEGTDVSDIRVRFVIVDSKGINYSFNCRQGDEAAKWVVTIPPMPYLPSGKYDFFVEIITNGYYFDPYKGTVEVTPKPTVSSSSSKPSKPVVTVSSADDTKKEEPKEDKKEETNESRPPVPEEKVADELTTAFLKSRENKSNLSEKERAVRDALRAYKKEKISKRNEETKLREKTNLNEKVKEEIEEAPQPVFSKAPDTIPDVPRRSNLASVIEKLDEPKDEQAKKIHAIIKGKG